MAGQRTAFGGGGNGGPPPSIITFAVKSVASGIGLVSEGMHARQEAKNDKKQRQSTSQTSQEESSTGPANNERLEEEEESSSTLPESLEAEWALDDAQEGIPGVDSATTNGIPDPRSADQIVDTFLQNNMALPFAVQNEPLARLQLPVLLPQRRPKDRRRGFIRAYAPALEPCGIDQTQWLAFLDTFEKSSQANPWINAINLASIGTMFMPSVTGIAVSLAIQVATGIAMEGHARYKTNNFLDKVNENYFKPRGLFCLLMTWNPESRDHSQSVSMPMNVASAVDSRNKFKASSAKSHGESLFPEVAPLIFPALDHLDQAGEEVLRTRNKLKKGKSFVDDYMDRRATAKYAAKHPESVLATSVPTPKFTSRYADPTHPASSGDIVSLVTGGHLSAGALRPSNSLHGGRRLDLGGLIDGVGRARGGIRNGLSGSSQGCYPQDGLEGRSRYDRAAERGAVMGGIGRNRGESGLDIKKLLKKDVLYLLVVNMPSDEEMAAAREELKQSRKGIYDHLLQSIRL
ncbi:hypothetical protein BP6252_07609 [Coleophoma cylindrospora]|uniref:Uncharacterized protein n=1 Tax=Coleophoma cylindrospora TaxID=1849047 RepID=A0A3D8RAP7_9HELO|nr:hypothetical protein BP6252_07609 [Coleophoma cylindrospora]